MRCHPRFILFVLFAAMGWVAKASQWSPQDDKRFHAALYEASDYVNLKPRKALEILEAHASSLPHVKAQSQFLYNEVAFWASAFMHDTERSAKYAQAMVETRNFPELDEHIADLLYSLSVWLRREQAYVSALEVGRCGLLVAKQGKEISRLTTTLGGSQFMLGNTEAAKAIYLIGLELSEKQKGAARVAVIKNNLGIIALLEQDLAPAQRYLMEALRINEELNRISGTSLNLANLMLTYYLQRDWHNFSRISARAERAAQMLNSEAVQHYVFWLLQAHQARTNKALSESEKQKLIDMYIEIDAPSIVQLVALIAKDLNIVLPRTHQRKPLVVGNFTDMFPACANIEKTTSSEVSLSDTFRKKIMALGLL